MWEASFLLKNLNREEMACVQKMLVEKTFEPNVYLLKDAPAGDQFYFVESGEVEEGLKNVLAPEQGLRTQRLKKGEVVGLVPFGDHDKVVTARAVSITVTRGLSLNLLAASYPAIAFKIAKNLGEFLSSRLMVTDEKAVNALKREYWQLKKRASMSSLAVKVICTVVIYQLTINFFLPFFRPGNYPLLGSVFVFLVGYLCYRFILATQYSPKMYGVTLRNWRISIQESLIATIPLLLGILIIKKLMIVFEPSLANAPLFELGIGGAPPALSESSDFLTTLSVFVYVLFSPIQEFIFRGVVQSSLHRVLVTKDRMLVSVILTNLLYVQAHFYWNFSLLVLLPGLVWSWLIIRHRTLIGVSISHIILGVWVFYIVGLNP